MARIQGTRASLRCLLALSSLWLVACSDDADEAAELARDGGLLDAGSLARDAGNAFHIDAFVPDSSVTTAVLKSCLDAPSTSSAPPSGALPCELVPPRF
ncbi:MAG: hypothetical protein JWN04_2246 [Myxococcaceae bacterium]|nr:hypothetical protein [Myxococcaceae bacterium]